LVHAAVSRFCASELGVKVELGEMHFEATTGKVQVHGLTVGNPEGYHSPYLLHVDRAVLDIDMRKLVFSFGKDIDVEELTLDGIDVNYEKALHTSNFNDILSQLSTNPEKSTSAVGEQMHPARVDKVNAESMKHDCVDAKAMIAGGASTVSSAVSQAVGTVRRAVGAEEAGKGERELTLHKVLVRNVGAKVATFLGKEIAARLEVEDISYEDFNTEFGGGRGVVDVIHVLLMTVIKSVLANVLGKHTRTKVKGAVDGAERRLKKGFSEVRGALKARQQQHP